MKEIGLILTEELIQELLNRYEHAIFMGVKIPQLEKDGKYVGEIVSLRRWIGNSYTCAGLCASLSRSIMSSFTDREKEYINE